MPCVRRRAGLSGGREAVHAPDGAGVEGRPRGGRVDPRRPGAADAVHEVRSDGEEDGRHQGAVQR